MDTSKITTGSSVRLAPGTYSVSTALSLTVPDTGLRGQGPASATVINSTVATGSALTIDGASEGSKFTLNSQTSGDGLNVVDGNVDHVASTNSESHACTGVHATIVESLCRSTYAFGAGFQTSQGSASVDLLIDNSTLVGGEFGYGMDVLTAAPGDTLGVSLSSSIVYSATHPIALRTYSIATLDFHAETSNFSGSQVYYDGAAQATQPPDTDLGNQSAAPIFTNAAGGDFTQGAGSPTIDKGAVDGRSGSLDLGGNARVQGAAADIGAFESAPVVVVPPPVDGGSGNNPPAPDIIKPTLKISKKPKSKTTSKKLSVTFTASETSTFLCKLDKGSFKACKSPYKKTVKLGKHKLQIKATDTAGNVSLTKTVQWEVHK